MMTRRVWVWGPVVVWMGFIQYASVRPVVEIPTEVVPHSDKVLHALAYALLALLLVRALRRGSTLKAADIALAAFAWSTAFGAAQEMLQYFLPNRTCDLFDLLANAAGAGLAVIAAWLVARRGR